MNDAIDRSSIRALPWPSGARRAVRRIRALKSERELRRLRRRLAGPKILAAFAEAYPTASFVEIGANDGEQHDHLRPILESAAWTGLMVEPVPYVFERLRANYAALPTVELANVAIADRDGELPFYHLEHVADREALGLPRWYDGLGSFSREAVLNHAGLVPGLADRLTCVSVPCLTFDSLCRRHGIDHVDLLLVDTEGYDHEILRNIDWTAHRPRLVVYEHYHLDAADRRDLRERLKGLGYELKEEGFDTWCLDTTEADELTATFKRLTPALPGQSVSEDR